ncbi:MAG TPA: hypothetical protein VI893_03160, partial [Thermoplasmata archaeon]|nr:hypothetical protein [Thermoplasmata archaeon]
MSDDLAMGGGAGERGSKEAPRLVGRDADLSRVVQVIESSRKQGCVVFAIGGEAGVGKTAVVEGFA